MSEISHFIIHQGEINRQKTILKNEKIARLAREEKKLPPSSDVSFISPLIEAGDFLRKYVKSVRIQKSQYFDIAICSIYSNTLPIFYQLGGIFNTDNGW